MSSVSKIIAIAKAALKISYNGSTKQPHYPHNYSHLNALSELLLLVNIAYICSRYLLPKYVVKIVTMNLKNGDVASPLGLLSTFLSFIKNEDSRTLYL